MLRRDVRRASDAVGRLDHAAIDTEVVRSVFGIARDPDAGGDEGGRVEARWRYQVREPVDPAIQIGRLQDDFLAGRRACLDELRRQVLCLGFGPPCADAVRFDPEGSGVYRAGTAE